MEWKAFGMAGLLPSFPDPRLVCVKFLSLVPEVGLRETFQCWVRRAVDIENDDFV